MKKILLCGDSVMIAGLAVSLRTIERIELMQLSETMVLDNLQRLQDSVPLPDMVVVDKMHCSSQLTRWCLERAVPVVAVDTDGAALMVVSGKALPVTTMQEAAQRLADLCDIREL